MYPASVTERFYIINMRALIAIVSALWILGSLTPATVLAWNDTGHQVVASIAWDHLSETARQNVTALMAKSTNAVLLGMFPQDDRPLPLRQREFFLAASTWPDVIRGTVDDRPTWHHRNLYWKQVKGQAVDLPDIEVNPENVLERLAFITRSLAEASTPAEERAMLASWLLHLVGDLHQPLHVGARVTATEPRGTAVATTSSWISDRSPTRTTSATACTSTGTGCWTGRFRASPRKRSVATCVASPTG